MGCGGSKTSKSVDDYESETEDYDGYDTRSKQYEHSPRGRNNNYAGYGNYNNSNKSTPIRSGGTQTHFHNGSAFDEFPEANDKQGYKKRIRNSLIHATAGTNIDVLEKNIEKFENNRLEDCGDLTRARERLQYLKLRRDLRDSIRRSNVGVLEKTILEANSSRYASQLRPQIEAAQRKLEQLRELNEYNHDILSMDQATISEIHSYHRPPACVHDVMAACYMLLGHEEATLRDWSYLQSMAGKVGRDSLIHKVRDFDPSQVDKKTADRVKEILNYHDLGEVRVASNGAATFHVWASNIVDMIEKDNEELERTRRNEEEKHRREELDEDSEVQAYTKSKQAARTRAKGK